MPPLVIPNTVQIVATYGNSFSGQPMQNVVHITVPAAQVWGQTESDQVSADFLTAWTTAGSYKAVASNGVTFQGVSTRDIRTAGAMPFDSPQNDVGTSSGHVPFDCSMVITLRSSLNTRRGRGRIFIGGLGTPALSTGRINASTVTAIELWFSTLNGALTARGWPIGIASRLDLVTRTAISATIDNRWDTLRRRDAVS